MRLENSFFINNSSLSSIKNNKFKNCKKQKKSNFHQTSKYADNAIRNNALASINFKGISNSSSPIDRICDELKAKYGIDAEFEDIDIAQLFLECVEDFTALNDKSLFSGLKVKLNDNPDDPPISLMLSYDHRNNTAILIMSDDDRDAWEYITKEAYNNCDIPVNNVKYPLYFALANFLLFKNNPDEYHEFKDLKFQHITPLKELGENAAESAQDFLCSYIAAKMCGVSTRKYVDDISNVLAHSFRLNYPKSGMQNKECAKLNFKDRDEASTYLIKQYGVIAQFEDIDVANYTVDAIEDFVNYFDDKNALSGLVIKSEGLNNDRISELYFIDENSYKFNYIALNKNLSQKDREKIARKEYDSGETADKNTKFNFYCNLIGWKLANENEDAFWELGFYRLSNKDRELLAPVAPNINSLIEFIKEYSASAILGIKYPEKINEIFRTILTEA